MCLWLTHAERNPKFELINTGTPYGLANWYSALLLILNFSLN